MHTIKAKDWHFVKRNVYDKCGFELTELKLEEGKEYGACTFKLNGKTVIFRIAKITPKKTGQFVAIWKRNEQGITQPFTAVDEIDFMIISAQLDECFGQFIFPKAVLIEQKIISNGQEEGKRGMRIYPPWDEVYNKQAKNTKNWQKDYFVKIEENNTAALELLKALLK